MNARDECSATEAYEGLLLIVALAAHQKAIATLGYAACMKHPLETLELEDAKCAINIMLKEIYDFVEANAEEEE